MEKSRLEMKVGLFVAIGLILLAVLVIQFSKGTSLFRSTYMLKLHAVNVGGLKEKSGVLLSGVQIGTVSGIHLAPDGRSVNIILKVYKDFPIYHDARFVIETAGILGDQFVSVIPTENKERALVDGDEVECQQPFDLQEVARSAAGFIQRLDGTAAKLDAAVTDLRAQVLNAQTLASFGTSITNLRVFTEQAIGTIKGINEVITNNGAQISLAMSNVVYFSTELTTLASAAQNVLATNGSNLTAATKNLEEISVAARQLTADVQAGKGLAGAVLENPEVATNLQDIAANLAITTSNLNVHGLWGILWSHSPPSTNKSNRTR
jgi:phospholipid/cholesterol/gamma-HCH transport system substrate-binding protein